MLTHKPTYLQNNYFYTAYILTYKPANPTTPTNTTPHNSYNPTDTTAYTTLGKPYKHTLYTLQPYYCVVRSRFEIVEKL